MTFAFLQVDIVPAVSFIGAITFVLSCIGVKIGHVFGTKYKSRAELFGGIVLILMGLKSCWSIWFSGIKLNFTVPQQKKSTPRACNFFCSSCRISQSRNRQDRRTAVRRIQFSIKVRAVYLTFIPLPRDTCPP